MNSSQTLYKDEKRAIEITIRDHNDIAYSPSAAYVEINNSEGTTINEQNCMIIENRIYCYIAVGITQTPGRYFIHWTIRKDMYIFKHKTEVLVLEL